MAASKKSAQALEKELEVWDRRVKAAEEQLRRCREGRKRLRAKLAEAQAGELLDIIETHEIPFEAAKDILAAAKNTTEQEEERHE